MGLEDILELLAEMPVCMVHNAWLSSPVCLLIIGADGVLPEETLLLARDGLDMDLEDLLELLHGHQTDLLMVLSLLLVYFCLF